MTISNQTILRNDYIANGTNTIFAFNFPIFYEPSEVIKFSIQVIITNELGAETIKTENTDYTITYNTLNIDNNVINQGNVVFTTAPANLYKVSLLRKLNLTQNTNLTNKGTDKFSGANVEASLDKLTLINLENKEIFNRCVLLPKSSSLTNIEFPIDLDRADQAVVINAAGNNLTTKNLADINLATLTNFAKTLMDDNDASEARATLNAQELNANLTALSNLTDLSNLTALSNLTDLSNLTALSNLTGASNKLPYFTGVGTMAVRDLLATNAIQGISYLPQKITIANNTSDPNNDIDFSSGNFVFSDFSGQAYVPAMTKRLDANWTAGTNQGGLDTGTKQVNTPYYGYAIYNPTTNVADIIFSASPTSPTLPSGFTKYRRIKGAFFLTNSSANIRGFSYFAEGGQYIWASPITVHFSQNTGGSQINDVSVPRLYGMVAYVQVQGVNDAVNAYSFTTISSGSMTINSGSTSSGSSINNGELPILNNTSSASITWGGNAARRNYIYTYGFIDTTHY